MATFDGGLFFLMLGLGLIFLLSSFKFGPIFQFVGGLIFVILGIIMFAGYDVAFETTVTDGTNQINQTNYVIGDGLSTTESNSSWLAWIFMIIGIMLWFFFIMGLVQGGGT